jgi:hypothetical protein
MVLSCSGSGSQNFVNQTSSRGSGSAPKPDQTRPQLHLGVSVVENVENTARVSIHKQVSIHDCYPEGPSHRPGPECIEHDTVKGLFGHHCTPEIPQHVSDNKNEQVHIGPFLANAVCSSRWGGNAARATMPTIMSLTSSPC